MNKNVKSFLLKLRTVSIGASPIVVIILAVHFFVKPMPTPFFVAFIVGTVLMVIGQAFFLVGLDSSILTMGELVGNNIRKLKKLWIILIFGFLFGTMATVAEPAVSVLAGNVHKVNPNINAMLLTWIVSSGIGIFVAYGLFRIFKQLSIKWSFLISYALVFILMIFTPNGFRAIAFDFSGATTGVITVPFILALGVGVTAVLGKKGDGDSYGMIGLASVGPIITMCIMGIIFGGGTGTASYPASTDPNFGATLVSSIKNISIAILPITVVFFIFNFMFVKLPRKKVLRVVVGILVTVFGLILFLTAISFGFSAAGRHIGEAFADSSRGDWFKYLLIPFGLILGFAIAYTEVAIRVLATQVEQNTNGHIKKGTLIFALALGLAITVAFSMLRILFSINILWFMIPIFGLALICMPFISKMFVGIAFDSGGVASGTITAAFLVPLAIGASSELGGRDPMVYSFGMIAFIAAIPMIAISLLGIIYQAKLRKSRRPVVKIAPTTVGNVLIAIVTRPEHETAIREQLRALNGRIMASFDAIGMSKAQASSPYSIAQDPKVFSLALISAESAAEMMEILQSKFEFTKDNRGIGVAFTIPLDKIEI